MVNKVILIGNVGKDPETKVFNENSQVSKLSLATSETYKDKQGQKQTNTEWHNIEIWGNLSKVVQKYVKKGTRLYVEGSIKTEQYQDSNGVTKYVTKIRCNQLTMLGDKQEAKQQATIVNNTPTPQQMNTQNNNIESDELPF